jgi:Xaa-Pro aminopeptidase
MKYILISILMFCSNETFPQGLSILTPQQQSETIDLWLEERLNNVLPELMEKSGIDMWLLISREYNEDPVLKTLLPSTWLSARRRTILVMYKPKGALEVEKLAVVRYDVGKSFKKAWFPEHQPNQWERLVEIIRERNPEKIGINMSDNFGHADGLNKTEFELLIQYLPAIYKERLVSAEDLAVRWLEYRTTAEINTYRHIQAIAHDIIQEGLSEKVITPGVTTTTDVIWWYRNKIASLGLQTWFHPTVDVQRANEENREQERTFDQKPGESVIQPGDVVHIDLGISYLRLHTDTQQLAYVLKPGEDKVPEYLQNALSVGNRLQDILTGHFKTQSTGNDILKASLNQMKTENIKGTIYTHPLGYHGHAAGPSIGMWDNQAFVPGSGEYPLHPQTVYAIELNAEVFLEEWQKTFRVMLEEGAFFDGQQVIYLNGRQTEFLTIPRQTNYLKN